MPARNVTEFLHVKSSNPSTHEDWEQVLFDVDSSRRPEQHQFRRKVHRLGQIVFLVKVLLKIHLISTPTDAHI